jgi:hypothetical protein
MTSLRLPVTLSCALFRHFLFVVRNRNRVSIQSPNSANYTYLINLQYRYLSFSSS